MSFAANEMVEQWDGFPVRTVHARNIAPGQLLYKGTLAMMVDGIAYRASAFNTLPMSGVILTVPGADANGGVLAYAVQANVRYIQITGGANRALGVSVAYTASTVDVTVQLATDAGSASTSTAQAVVNAITGHAVAGKFIKAGYTGTGLGITAALATLTSLKHVCVLGIAEDTYDNSTGLVSLFVNMRFTKGIVTLAGLSGDAPTAAMIDSQVAIVDNITVKATVNPLDLCVRLADVETDGQLRCSIL